MLDEGTGSKEQLQGAAALGCRALSSSRTEPSQNAEAGARAWALTGCVSHRPEQGSTKDGDCPGFRLMKSTVLCLVCFVVWALMFRSS